ncbi:MAG: DNA-directed RNA polymerase subunit A' [Candidatus Aenigmarchaeota archaeon ex4484_224]|nr:MAG: DNA-directed RNA polymerase subunit A' [Candidatus Aenigmarchaeota archaeon ex4484_224]
MRGEVKKIVFGVLSPEMIKKMAVAKITKPELYDEEGYPIEGGVMDPRLGVVDPGLRCRTCGGSVDECPGHFGYLELTKPVIHVLYVKLIHVLLNLFCPKCGRLMISEKERELLKEKKIGLKDIAKSVKTKCPYCKHEKKKIKLIKPYTFFEGNKQLNPQEVRERLEKISDEDLKLIGLGNFRPEWLVLTLLPIPPVTVRPSITLETGERSEDDLTHKLVDIVRINERLRENIELGAPDFIIEDLWELLQYHVSTYFDNELSGIPPARHRSGRVLKTLAQRLKTKEGRFRGNLAGKRVNFSARTVISPDPMIKIDEVGVPVRIAKELTIPVKVTKENLEEMKKLVLNGSDTWPGANYVIRPDGRRKRILESNKEAIAEELAPGYIVERHLMNGDIVLFNRQPSLHRMSMMAHKVRVMPFKTFRLHLSVCPPYNADFDGDEMNLHVPQTEEARAEAEILMAVEKNIRSPRFSGPIIGGRIDHVSGLYLLTQDDTVLEREEFVKLIRTVDKEIEIPKKNKMTGKEIFSLFLPKDFSITYKNKSGEIVVIEKGKLIKGTIDKAGIAAESGKILDKIEKEYGQRFAMDWLEKITRLAIEFLMMDGFSISISDQDLPAEARKKIEEIIKKANRDVNKLIEEFKSGKLKILAGRTPKESLEHAIKIVLRNTLTESQEVIVKYLKTSPTLMMAKSGARGDIVNLVQTAAMVGQEMVMGERIERGYHGRTFPHFRVGDISLEAKGFVKHGFKDGLTPFEFFFDATNSRESLMDKSLKTRHSGYMERRLIGALEDLKVEYDGTVRDAGKRIIQFVAGEDGLDPSKIQRGGIDVETIAKRLFG